MFIEATECIDSILKIFKELKVISLSEYKPWESLINS
jgi:hypothetical protein